MVDLKHADRWATCPATEMLTCIKNHTPHTSAKLAADVVLEACKHLHGPVTSPPAGLFHDHPLESCRRFGLLKYVPSEGPEIAKVSHATFASGGWGDGLECAFTQTIARSDCAPVSLH